MDGDRLITDGRGTQHIVPRDGLHPLCGVDLDLTRPDDATRAGLHDLCIELEDARDAMIRRAFRR